MPKGQLVSDGMHTADIVANDQISRMPRNIAR